MYAIIVRVYEHWFIPFEPGSDRQCIYTSKPMAERIAEALKIHYAKEKVYRDIRVVSA